MPSETETVSKPRRSFLAKLTLGLFSVGLLGQGWTYLRAMIPNILYEPPKRFKVGLPSELAEGVNFIDSHRVYIIRKDNQYSCISGKCTHLGCTVKYVSLDHQETVEIRGQEVTVDHEFHCPCHGSKFRQDGSPYSGPAPSALLWHRLEVAPEDGKLVVDVSSSVDSDFKLTV